MIKHPDENNLRTNCFYTSDYYFEHFYIGQVYRKWTDHIRKGGIVIDDEYDNGRTEFVKKSGYLPSIIHFSESGFVSEGRNDLYKITWNHLMPCPDTTLNYHMRFTEKEHIAKLFCIDGWEKEEQYYDFSLGSQGVDGMSPQHGDIKKYTLPWVDYLTFQNYRTIVQFWLDDYEKWLREGKLNRILV